MSDEHRGCRVCERPVPIGLWLSFCSEDCRLTWRAILDLEQIMRTQYEFERLGKVRK